MRLLSILLLCLAAQVALGQGMTVSDPAFNKHHAPVAAGVSVPVDLVITDDALVNGSLTTVTQINSSTIGALLDTTSTFFHDGTGNYTTAKAEKGNNSVVWPAWPTNLVIGGVSANSTTQMAIDKDANVDNGEEVSWSFVANTTKKITYGFMFYPPATANIQSGSASMDISALIPVSGGGATAIGHWDQWAFDGGGTAFGPDSEWEDSGLTIHNSSFRGTPSAPSGRVYLFESQVDWSSGNAIQINTIWDTTTGPPWSQVGQEFQYTNGVGTANGLSQFFWWQFDNTTWAGPAHFLRKNDFMAIGANAVFPINAILGLRFPDNFTASQASSSSVLLGWTAVSQATSYKIEQNDNGGGWVTIQPTQTGTSLTVSGLTLRHTYQYRISSNVAGYTSTPSTSGGVQLENGTMIGSIASGGTENFETSGKYGFKFLVNNNITITDLGKLFAPGNSQAHGVYLYTLAGTLIASNTVNFSGQSTAQYSQVTTPIYLLAGQSYYIFSSELNGGDNMYADATTLTFTTPADFTIQGSFYDQGSGITGNTGGNAAFGIPDFRYQLGWSSSTTPDIAWWSGSGDGSGTTLHDHTANAFNGTLSGATIPTWTTFTPTGANALLFNGSTGYVQGTTLGTFGANSQNGFTISAWEKSSFTSSYEAIYGYLNTGTKGITLYINYDGLVGGVGAGRIEGQVGDASGDLTTTDVAANTGITDGSWHNVTWVCIPLIGYGQVYVDGSPVTTVAGGIVTDMSTFGGTFDIGRRNGFNDGFFNGSIYDVAVFGKPLNAATISSIVSAHGP